MRRNFVLMFFVMEMLAACGQTGPLYLPEEQSPVEQETENAVTTEAGERTDAVANEAAEGDRTDAGDKGVELKEKSQ